MASFYNVRQITLGLPLISLELLAICVRAVVPFRFPQMTWREYIKSLVIK